MASCSIDSEVQPLPSKDTAEPESLDGRRLARPWRCRIGRVAPLAAATLFTGAMVGILMLDCTAVGPLTVASEGVPLIQPGMLHRDINDQLRRLDWHDRVTRTRRSDTALVMVDTRPLDPAIDDYFTYTTMNNLRYAAMHGYDLIYYHIIDRDAGNDGKKGHVCTHPVEGPRIGVWCRIPAVDYTLAEGYETVVYIDSDAFFNRKDKSITELLTAWGSPNSTFTLFADAPYSPAMPNSGIFIVRNHGGLGQSVIRRWWNSQAGELNMQEPSEQVTYWRHIGKNKHWKWAHHMIHPGIYKPCCSLKERKSVVHMAGVHDEEARRQQPKSAFVRDMLHEVLAEADAPRLGPDEMLASLRWTRFNATDWSWPWSQTAYTIYEGKRTKEPGR